MKPKWELGAPEHEDLRHVAECAKEEDVSMFEYVRDNAHNPQQVLRFGSQ